MFKYNLVYIVSCLALIACNGCSEDPVPASRDATVDVGVDVVDSSADSSDAVIDAASDASAPVCVDATVPDC